jgi:hypothetical protein
MEGRYRPPARGALGRQQKGRWGTTVANAWGVLAIDKFSQLFEKDKVAGTGATLGNASKSIAFGGDPAGGTAMLPWPRGGAVRWNWSTPARASRG